MDRPETGAMQFGDDWPGVFIRGDNAFSFGQQLHAGLTEAGAHMSPITLAVLKGLADTLLSGNINHPVHSATVTRLAQFDKCKPEPVTRAELLMET